MAPRCLEGKSNICRANKEMARITRSHHAHPDCIEDAVIRAWPSLIERPSFGSAAASMARAVTDLHQVVRQPRATPTKPSYHTPLHPPHPVSTRANPANPALQLVQAAAPRSFAAPRLLGWAQTFLTSSLACHLAASCSRPLTAERSELVGAMVGAEFP